MAATLLEPWAGAYGGVPAFAGVTPDALREALALGMDAQRAEIAAIAAQDAAGATFASVIEALEDAGRALGRAQVIYQIFTSTMNDAAMQALETEMEPKLAAFADEVVQNSALFARIKAVYDGRAAVGLTPEQLRLVETVYERFHRNGAALDGDKKRELAEINTSLATLYARFSQNLLAEAAEQYLALESEGDAAGLPDDFVGSLRAAAAEKNAKFPDRPPCWGAVANTRSAMEPFLTLSSRRDLRERAFNLFISRGETSNRGIIRDVLALRQRKAALLGHPSFAHWMLSDNMAATPETALGLVMRVWTVAVAAARRDVGAMQALFEADGGAGAFAPWDHRYYAEKLRKAQFDLDDGAVKQYLQLDRLVEGLMWSASKLHGIAFARLPDGEVPTWHADVQVYRVSEAATGAHVGLFYFDPFVRAGKRGGAWMCDHRPQESFKGEVPPIVSNNLNLVRAAPGEVTVISWDDARTLFHEMGHGLHGLLSKVRYPTLSGTNVKRDFVELPSQLNEHWLTALEMLQRFALHRATGEPIPDALIAKINAARNANQGFSTVEYLASAIYDMRVHLAAGDASVGPAAAATKAFEEGLMAEVGLPAEIAMRHFPAHFEHVFSSDGYAAQYYSYIFADVLNADVAEAFSVDAKGDMYDQATAERLRKTILSVGNTVDPAQAFRNFRGRDPDPDALMRDRGFA